MIKVENTLIKQSVLSYVCATDLHVNMETHVPLLLFIYAYSLAKYKHTARDS